MTKTQTWAEAHKLLVASKASKALVEAMELLLAPKSSASVANPPKLDEKGNITEAWCRFHERYEKVEAMVMSQGKSKGYCKASISLWNKTNSNIKQLNDKAVCAMSEGQMEDAQKHAKESEALKAKFNNPEFYDYDRDWKEFNKPAKPAEVKAEAK